ncbi:hypothetical protein HMPREF0208_03966 [Citrobacter koseri]|nr:hypothetical protein HMPREF0208_03966 [Citrobacter koseri]
MKFQSGYCTRCRSARNSSLIGGILDILAICMLPDGAALIGPTHIACSRA